MFIIYCRGANLSQKKRPYKNVSRIPSKQAISKRICRNKAITKGLKHARTNCNHKAKAERINKQRMNDY